MKPLWKTVLITLIVLAFLGSWGIIIYQAGLLNNPLSCPADEPPAISNNDNQNGDRPKNLIIEKPTTEDRKCLSLLDDFQVALLKEAGLKDPIKDLHADLYNHPELIPVPGELGGTMHFEGDFVVVSDHWAVSRFSDGHVEGILFLSYTVQNGNIKWKVMATDCPNP